MNAMIVLGTGILLCMATVLTGWYKGRKERAAGEELPGKWPYGLFGWAGYLLWRWYEKIPGIRHENARQALRRALSGLLVRDSVEDAYRAFQVRRFTRAWMLAAAALLTGMVLEAVRLYTARQPVGELVRPQAGMDSVQYPLEAEGAWEGRERTVVSVSPRAYTRQQAEALFEEVYVQALQLLPGENRSLDQVEKPLYFLRSGPPGIEIRWTPEQWEYMDHDGAIVAEEIPEEGILTYVTLALSYQTQRTEYQIPCRLVRPASSGESHLERELSLLLREQEEKEPYESQVMLPESYQGQSVTFYRLPGRAKGLLAGGLGLLAAVLCGMQCTQKVQEQSQKRERQMQADYPEILSKMTVLLAAGFTLRGAWEKIAMNYVAQTEKGMREKRYAYEEMLYACRGMQSGQSELQAYKSFGKRCGLPAYRRLSMLLEQNLKRGGRELTDRLRAETEEAFSVRLHQARREGEKAGTKLMIPMFMMFILVLVLIMAPAVMSFSGI